MNTRFVKRSDKAELGGGEEHEGRPTYKHIEVGAIDWCYGLPFKNITLAGGDFIGVRHCKMTTLLVRLVLRYGEVRLTLRRGGNSRQLSADQTSRNTGF
jgi:hypothetical protein